MAINKRKILQSAQKHLQKGSLEKALKDYQTLLKADPRDVNIRLKIGDLHVRQGHRDEAIEAYLKVAERFTSDGFDAKAVALYKQVAKLDPKRSDIYLPLSELYQRLGLGSEAMSALQSAADAHYREGDKAAALEILRKMAALDPANTINRLKVAELLRQEGMTAEAVAEYEAAAAELERQGEEEARMAALAKVLELAPERGEIVEALGRGHLALKRWGNAEEMARRLLDLPDDAVRGYELLAEVYRGQGREAELPELYRRMAEIYKERGDDEAVRDILQRYGGGTSLVLGEAEGEALLETDENLDVATGGNLALGAGDPFDSMSLPSDGALPLGEDAVGGRSFQEPGAEAERPRVSPLPPLRDFAPERPGGGGSAEPGAEGDPDQLLAEASVYLRYGKHERAIESLRAVLAQQPEHAAALEKLGEAFEASGDTQNAAEAFARCARIARDGGNLDAFAALREKVGSLDPAAAEPLELLQPIDSSIESGADALGGGAEPEAVEIDVEIDTQFHDEDLDDAAPPGDDVVELDVEPTPSERGGSEPATLDELTLDEPSAAIEPAEQDFAHPQFDASELDEPISDRALDEALEVGSSEGALEPALERDEPPATDAPGDGTGQLSAATREQIGADLQEADFYFQQGLLEEAKGIYRRILSAAPNHPQAMLRLGEIEAASGDRRPQAPEAEPSPDATLLVEPEALESESTSEPAADHFDLAAELSDSFRADESPSGPVGPVGGTQEEGFEQVFSAFKKGVERELGEGDYETHYDLGIAYREMGLLEDAIGEFQVALGGPTRKLDCLHMMGLCALGLNRVTDAIAHFEQALALPEVPERQSSALRFDLGRAYEAGGDLERAKQAYQEVASADPTFCDVGDRLAALEGRDAADAAPDGSLASPEAFESFDDLVADCVGDDELSSGEEPDEPSDVDADDTPPVGAEAPAPGRDDASPDGPSASGAPEESPVEPPTQPDPPDLSEAGNDGDPEPGDASGKPEKKGRFKKISFF